MFTLSQEKPEDYFEVEYLLDLTFAPGRTALSSYRLRDGVEPVADLSIVARDDANALVGSIRFWPVHVGDQNVEVLLLGPVAVHPTCQGEGLGGALINAGIERAKELGWKRVLLVGDEPYYSRFGFQNHFVTGLEFPPPTNPERILGKELEAGAYEGVAGEVTRWQSS